ncbi:uncharacterized protein FIESC28_02337 [Fusarium coffeatum]|uniref:Apple domain-containing protein n=1 Tax=Fusarium coffeatum TaxID=231269 RepID=A0A366S682_9HYPO|nr:uncharacterized protein FIESC28_02337 [Fusarium coffeatum]RBR24847.1 hypothetical protein FIESC28_02337 [Fusarium coffeatum]
MTTHCDTSPEVVPSDLPQTVYPNGEHNNWSSQGNNGYQFPTSDNAYHNDSLLPPKPEAESTVQTVSGSGEENKWKRRCSCLVIALAIALVVACAVAVALGAVLGVTIKEKQESQAEMKALYVSLSASETSTYIATSVSLSGPEIPSATATSASASATQDEREDISNGCSAEEDELTNTTYTSEFKPFSKFAVHCNDNAANVPVYSVFASSFHSCIEACASWNTYPIGKSEKCEAVSFIPGWSNIATAAGVPAAGNCFLKPGPQTNGKLEYTGGTTHAAILKS